MIVVECREARELYWIVVDYHKYAFSVWGRRVTPAVFGPQVYPGPIVCVLKDGLLSMTNGPPLLVCHWMGYTIICDNSPQSKSH